jgi:hypothetical protein
MVVGGTACGCVKGFRLNAEAISGPSETTPTSVSNSKAAAAMASFIVVFDVLEPRLAGYTRQPRRSVAFLDLQSISWNIVRLATQGIEPAERGS